MILLREQKWCMIIKGYAKVMMGSFDGCFGKFCR